MAGRDVDGYRLPRPVAGHPALELCNTFVGWGEDETVDYLQTYAHLVVLADDLGLLPPGAAAARLDDADRDPQAATRVLRAARRYRAQLFGVLVEDGPAEPVLRAGAAALSAAQAERSDDGVVLWPGDGPAQPLQAFALAAVDLLRSGLSGEVHRCPGTQCGWLFLDRSGRRRWCIMATCGNRAKVRAHAARTRAR